VTRSPPCRNEHNGALCPFGSSTLQASLGGGDRLVGGSGNHSLSARGGGDTLLGGAGRDNIYSRGTAAATA
jgi:Ca2+-binding RTX toxin-like protein